VHGEEAARDLATGVKDLHVKEDWESEDQLLQRKNRVSFGTNMTSEDESSGNDSCMQAENKLTTAAERFHARKFGSQNRESSDRRPALKVMNPGKVKKQRTPVKTAVQDALKTMGQEGMQLMLGDAKKEPVEKLDVEMADEAAAPMVDPKILWSVRSNEHLELKLSGIGATLNS
jgi:hypothetical protein